MFMMLDLFVCILKKKGCFKMKKNLDEFINNISAEDIDYLDKMDNLCGGSQISGELYEVLANNKELESKIIQFVIDNVYAYEQTLRENMDDFAKWYDEDELENYDYRDALYNCDEIFLQAIIYAVGIYI